MQLSQGLWNLPHKFHLYLIYIFQLEKLIQSFKAKNNLVSNYNSVIVDKKHVADNFDVVIFWQHFMLTRQVWDLFQGLHKNWLWNRYGKNIILEKSTEKETEVCGLHMAS